MDARSVTRESSEWRAAVYSRLGSTSKVTSETHVLLLGEFSEIKRKLCGLEDKMRVLTYAPGRCRHVFTVETRRGSEVLTGTPAQGQDARPATLSPRPKLLLVLWDEWMNGIGGRLPAKDFSPCQQGKCKKSVLVIGRFFGIVCNTSLIMVVQAKQPFKGYLVFIEEQSPKY